MERHILNFCSEYVTLVVKDLSSKYEFDADEALSSIELPTIVKRSGAGNAVSRRKETTATEKKPSKTQSRMLPSIPLPFCGKINDTWCHAILKNNKLFTQCTNRKEDQGDYCKKCVKGSLKEGTMPFGDISSRLECAPLEFKDPKGVAVVPYIIVMNKLNISRETAEAEAMKFGWTISEEQFTIPEKAKGRPKKTAVAEEETSSDNEDKKDAKRGRPKKDKPVKASSQVGDDIIAGLLAQADAKSSEEMVEQNVEPAVVAPDAVAEKPKKKTATNKNTDKEAEKKAAKLAKEAAKAAKEAEKPAKTNKKAADKPVEVPVQQQAELEAEEEEESEEEEKQQIKVKKFEFQGVKYKRSEPDNILYDWETDEPVGVWNPKTNKIDELADDEEEEDDE